MPSEASGPGQWHSPGPDGSTPLDHDEADGLIPTWVAVRGDLNEVEQANILKMLLSPRWQRIDVVDLLDDKTARELHKQMFGDVWSWAGRYRTKEKNIGVDPSTIGVRTRGLMEDVRTWLDRARPPHDQVAYEFHHRLVSIHPFPNGNGRHARAMADLLLRGLGQPVFTWGSGSLDDDGYVRKRYLMALRAADTGDYEPLALFVRS